MIWMLVMRFIFIPRYRKKYFPIEAEKDRAVRPAKIVPEKVPWMILFVKPAFWYVDFSP